MTLAAKAGGPNLGAIFICASGSCPPRDDVTLREIHYKSDKCFETGLRDVVSSAVETA